MPEFDSLSPADALEPNPAVERLFAQADGARGEVKVVQQIGREIVAGIYPADARLPDEPTMLARYGISRTALREAYGQLAVKGMIFARPKVGTSVRPQIYWNMLDADVLLWHLETKPIDEIALSLYPLRRMVEPGAAALAAQMRTDEDLRRIEQAYQQMKTAGRSRADLIEADLRFHLEILTATHNPFIGAFSALIHTTMQRTLELGWDGAEHAAVRPARLLQHLDVYEAIRLRNAETAKMRMEILIDDSIKDVVEGLENRPDDKPARSA